MYNLIYIIAFAPVLIILLSIGFLTVQFLVGFIKTLISEIRLLHRLRKKRPLMAKDWLMGTTRCLPPLFGLPLPILFVLSLCRIFPSSSYPEKYWFCFGVTVLILPLFFWTFRTRWNWTMGPITLLLSLSATFSTFSALYCIANEPGNSPYGYPFFKTLFCFSVIVFLGLLFFYIILRLQKELRSFSAFAWDVSMAISMFLPSCTLFTCLCSLGKIIVHIYDP